MAPEMALGQPVDARADIYALGGMVYFRLTGATMFESANGYSAIAMLLRDEPVPPSQRTIPPALDRLVVICLARKPHDPQTARRRSAARSRRSTSRRGLRAGAGVVGGGAEGGEATVVPMPLDVATYLH
jgi:serine/threonine-protein kinase